jgi:hypothetical protein
MLMKPWQRLPLAQRFNWRLRRSGDDDDKGVIEKVDGAKKEFALKGEYSKPVAIFDWNASTRFIENGKPTVASQLKMGERATVNYARQGKQRVATEIAISPSGKTAQQVEKTNAPRKHYTARNWLDS